MQGVCCQAVSLGQRSSCQWQCDNSTTPSSLASAFAAMLAIGLAALFIAHSLLFIYLHVADYQTDFMAVVFCRVTPDVADTA